jgi:hypothetical protein
MTKLLPSLAIALALTAGVAAPALANDSFDSFDASYQLQRLNDAGINAVDVAEDTSSTMRANIKLDDGSQVFQYYNQDNLQPIGQAGGAATRVLTKLDVQRSAPTAGTPQSLVWQGDGSF